ncbi:hypothetical protein niasHS_011206 [Heterodera schachtii]|uniref:Uncharacterized protein n=1 Tax=Heterodera schachtii TaxID=97005 RepID=A0ABD2ITT9_HETSC
MDNFPLHRAVFSNEVEIVKKHMAEMNKKDTQGNTPLHIACMLGNKDIVQLLLEKGAKVRSRNNAGWNALDEAIAYGDIGLDKIVISAFRMGQPSG